MQAHFENLFGFTPTGIPFPLRLTLTYCSITRNPIVRKLPLVDRLNCSLLPQPLSGIKPLASFSALAPFAVGRRPPGVGLCAGRSPPSQTPPPLPRNLSGSPHAKREGQAPVPHPTSESASDHAPSAVPTCSVYGPHQAESRCPVESASRLQSSLSWDGTNRNLCAAPEQSAPPRCARVPTQWEAMRSPPPWHDRRLRSARRCWPGWPSSGRCSMGCCPRRS